MARRVLAYECRHCGAIKKTEKICLRHEKACLKNPESRNCILCQHSIPNSGSSKLLCQKGKACSQAISANCEHFVRKNVAN